jgi:RNA polymerase sigma-70 factor, ECF subfamily
MNTWEATTLTTGKNLGSGDGKAHFESELLVRVRYGESGAYEALTRAHQRVLHRVARRILKDDADAEDAIQDAHLRALTHLDQFAGRSSFGTWLTSITANAAMSRLRVQRRFPTVDSSEIPEDRTKVMVSRTRTPEQQTLSREVGRVLQAAVDALPERYRSVFTLREIDEMPTAEVTRRLGISEQCLKTRLHRARSLLRKRIPHELRPSSATAEPETEKAA